MPDYYRLVLSLDGDALERFTRDWVALRRSSYHEVQRFSGPQDLGRDVVGFLTPQRHEGHWHNYQCKQYTRQRVPLNDGFVEIAKIFYHAYRGRFTLPTKYFFVAPYGLNRKLELLLDKPTEFKEKFIKEWDNVCATKLAVGKNITLDSELRGLIRSFDFGEVTRITLEEMLAEPNANLVLHQHFGADPGPAPRGEVPEDVLDTEATYISQLIDAYGEREGITIQNLNELLVHAQYKEHLTRQRERFYDADFFRRHYRDNTAPHVLPDLDQEIYHGIVDVHGQHYQDTLGRVDAVMIQAAQIQAAGPLAPHARVTVKQGLCHHLVNEGRIRWEK